jgi:hypothetical protein
VCFRQIELLRVLPGLHIPDVQRVAVLAGQQQLGIDAVLHHVGCAPLAGEHGIVAQVPEEIVGQVLWSAILLPASLWLKGLMVEHEDAARAVAVRRAECVHVDPIGTAVHRVRRGVAGLPHDLVALDHLDQTRTSRIRVRVHDVDPRAAGPRHHEVAAFRMRVRRVPAEVRAAGIPAEVMQLVPSLGEFHLAHEPAVSERPGVGIHHAERIVLTVVFGGKQRHIGQGFSRRFTGQLRRRVESWIGKQAGHGILRRGQGALPVVLA